MPGESGLKGHFNVTYSIGNTTIISKLQFQRDHYTCIICHFLHMGLACLRSPLRMFSTKFCP